MKKLKSVGMVAVYLVIAIVTLFAAGIVIGVVYIIGQRALGMSASAAMQAMNGFAHSALVNLLTMLLAYAGFVLIFGLIYGLWISRKQPVKYIGHKGLSPKNLLLILVAGLMGQILTQLLMVILKFITPNMIAEYVKQVSVLDMSKTSPALVILSSCIIGPIAEELLFRGCIYNTFKKGFSVKVSMLITTLVFAAYHMNLTQFIYVVPFGLATCIIYEKTKTIWASIIFHIIYNSSTFLLTTIDCDVNLFIQWIVMLISIPLFVVCLIKIKNNEEMSGNNENI